jgi:hypothetical protein
LETTFAIASDTTVVDKDGNPTTVTWISNGDNVSMEYTVDANGSKKTAKSIKMLAGW